MKRYIKFVLYYVKKTVKLAIPGRVVAQLRLHPQSRYVRWNVDVYPTDQRDLGRWVDTTPDTYRIRLDSPMAHPETGQIEVLTDPSFPADDSVRDRAVQLLGDTWLAAVVAGDTDRPRTVNRSRVEPTVGPRLVAIRREILEEVGGLPPGQHPLPGLLQRIRDAGHPYGLIPLPQSRAPVVRSDPIEAEPVVVVSLVPMHDIGGGARSAQIALEMLRQGYHVTYVSHFRAEESVDLGLRFVHPNLEQHHWDDFDPSNLLTRCSGPGTILVEAPAKPLIDAAAQFDAAGWRVVYDIIDDWSDPALGGLFYDPEHERRLLAMADRVVASAPDLVERARRLGYECDLVPNAVNAAVFGVDLPLRPDDLPEAAVVIGYHGSLYGDWFDWDSLRRVAEAFPEAALVVIGDDKAGHPEMPANVRFLGLKPVTALPGYLQRFDVGLLSFKLNETTHAVSPLKVYEYLASGVPVAAPPLRSLEGLDGIVTHSDLLEAVRRALRAPRPDRAAALQAHSWTDRVNRIMGADRAPSVPAASILSRLPVHWEARDRLVRPS